MKAAETIRPEKQQILKYLCYIPVASSYWKMVQYRKGYIFLQNAMIITVDKLFSTQKTVIEATYLRAFDVVNN